MPPERRSCRDSAARYPCGRAEKSSRQDLVTDADEAAEAAIAASLLKAFPGAVVVGEESTERDPSLLRGPRPARPRVHHRSHRRDQKLRIPLAAFRRHGGGWCGRARSWPASSSIRSRMTGPWRCAEKALSSNMRTVAATTSGWGPHRHWPRWRASCPGLFFPPERRNRVAARLSRVANASDYRCAAHQYRLLAAGFYDFALYSKLSPWDHAAGWLLHREAGGYSACLDGSPYAVTRHEGGLLCTPDRGKLGRSAISALRRGVIPPQSALARPQWPPPCVFRHGPSRPGSP